MPHKLILIRFLESTGVSTDSRKVEPGQIFFALKGANFDGNAYAAEVLDQGASYAIIDDPKAHVDHRTILVKDSLKALQILARDYRRQFKIPVLAITGSNGKTTTKELLSTVLSAGHKLHSTNGNFNNHIGVPLTLLQAPRDTELMVIEMGANHIGEIKALCEIAEPTHGLITNVGQAHLEGFGSYHGVILAKTELYRYLAATKGKAFYNEADRVLYYNLPAELEALTYRHNLSFENHGLQLGFTDLDSDINYLTQLSGSYNEINISATVTIGQYFNIPKEVIYKRIAEYTPTNNRSQLLQKGDTTFLMDAYNANPTSMMAAIDSFAALQSPHSKILIIGDMKELGPDSLQLHKACLDHLESYPWDKVILVGQEFSKANDNPAYLSYQDILELSKDKATILPQLSNKLCLVKASRSTKLEKIVELYN